MERKNYRIPLLILCLIIVKSGYSQQLNLFEEIETNNGSSNQARDRVRGENRATSSSPEFTLIGTSIIGSKYSVIIQHRNGDQLVVKADLNSNTQIPGYNGYSLLEVNSGGASIRYPDNVPCVEFREQGVSCDNVANIAALSLANSEPLSSKEMEIERGVSRSGEAPVDESPINPFEALRAQQNSGASSSGISDSDRFTPRRISPEDVPPGMRVVSTPFGDRLVER